MRHADFCIALLHHLQIALWNLASRIALWRFERQAQVAQRVNDDTLRTILRRNRATAIGQRLGFIGILAAPDSIRRYRERVPVTTYEDYGNDVERIAAGESDILTADTVTCFGGSSGTTGAPKRIPSTKRSRAIYARFAGLVMRGVLLRRAPPGWSHRPGINLMSMAASRRAPPGSLPLVSMTHTGMRAIRWWLSALWISPAVVFEVRDPNASMYLHALFALRRDDPVYIYDVFAPHLLAWLRMIEARRDDLLRDVAEGSLAADLALTSGERKRLAPYLVADSARAAVLQRHFSQGSRGIAGRIWPGLSVVSVVATGGFSFCMPALRRYLGSDMRISSPLYGATESLVGVSLDPAADTYVLTCGAAYFEFVPVADGRSRHPVEISGLEIGSRYEVIVTTVAGLYRYRLDDVVEVVGFHGQAPFVRFLYRHGTIINLCGEKMTEVQTAAALERALGGAGRCIEYAVTIALTAAGCCYRFYIELADEQCCVVHQPVLLARALDDELCVANICYRRARHRARIISVPEICLLRAGAFERLRVRLQSRAGVPGIHQVKTPRLVRDPVVVAMLNAEVSLSSEFPCELAPLIK